MPPPRPLSEPCPPLDPQQAQAGFEALEDEDSRRLMRACSWSWVVMLGLGAVGVVFNRPGAIGLGLAASGGVLWCEYHRRCVPAPACPVEQGLREWIQAQDDPVACARDLAQLHRNGDRVREVASKWLAERETR